VKTVVLLGVPISAVFEGTNAAEPSQSTWLRPPKRQAKRRVVPGASRRRETGTHFFGIMR
jgi:hypothetical protein